MLHRLCGPPSIPLSVSPLRAYSPGGALIAFASVPGLPPTPGAHRLLCGLPGYLNLFAPRTFAPQRQYMARYPPSPPVFFLKSTDFTLPPGIPISPPVLKPASSRRSPAVEPRDFTPGLTSRLRALYAQSFRTTLVPYVLPRLLARS